MKENELRKIIESVCNGFVDTLMTGIDENKKDVLPVGELKKKTGMVIKGSHKVFADQPDSRFNKKVQTNDQEKSTTYPLMKGRLK